MYLSTFVMALRVFPSLSLSFSLFLFIIIVGQNSLCLHINLKRAKYVIELSCLFLSKRERKNNRPNDKMTYQMQNEIEFANKPQRLNTFEQPEQCQRIEAPIAVSL